PPPPPRSALHGAWIIYDSLRRRSKPATHHRPWQHRGPRGPQAPPPLHPPGRRRGVGSPPPRPHCPRAPARGSAPPPNLTPPPAAGIVPVCSGSMGRPPCASHLRNPLPLFGPPTHTEHPGSLAPGPPHFRWIQPSPPLTCKHPLIFPPPPPMPPSGAWAAAPPACASGTAANQSM
ncbi:MAG: hypothetical protein J3K34DRAFT_420492, partial [Monoraphidium minutum]